MSGAILGTSGDQVGIRVSCTVLRADSISASLCSCWCAHPVWLFDATWPGISLVAPQVLHHCRSVNVNIDCNDVCIDCNVCEADLWPYLETVPSLLSHSSCILLICLSTHLMYCDFTTSPACQAICLSEAWYVCHRLGRRCQGIPALGCLQLSHISGPLYNYCLLLLLPCTAG